MPNQPRALKRQTEKSALEERPLWARRFDGRFGQRYHRGIVSRSTQGPLPMSSDPSVTSWLEQLKAGDHAAAGPLWERYFHLLVRRARAALGSAPRGGADEEDVALSAFDSFCRGAEQGRFPQLDDRDDLWRLLLVITARKAARLARDQRTAKRGGKVSTEIDLTGVIGTEPTPELAASVAEEYRRLLARLPDEQLRSIAVWRMEGYTVEEIAQRLGRVPRTVNLKLAAIRGLWSEEKKP
jgi:DNA-directed RNA polymerase specialized sigma24 family protein